MGPSRSSHLNFSINFPCRLVILCPPDPQPRNPPLRPPPTSIRSSLPRYTSNPDQTSIIRIWAGKQTFGISLVSYWTRKPPPLHLPCNKGLRSRTRVLGEEEPEVRCHRAVFRRRPQSSARGQHSLTVILHLTTVLGGIAPRLLFHLFRRLATTQS